MKELAETKIPCGKQWQYKSATELNRGVNEVLIEPELKAALILLNLQIAERNELADEVINLELS